MFQLVEGNYASNLQEIQEGYTKSYNGKFWCFHINVSAEHIGSLFIKLCAVVRQPSFLLFEHGTSQAEEEKLRLSNQDPFHKDILYLDGLDYQRFEAIYHLYQELLVHDGEICFGLGSHEGMDEVYVGAYKIFTIFTDTPEKYEQILQQEGFLQKEDMKTIWSTFTAETPGHRSCVKKNGIDIYEMIEELKEQGLYLAERRAD